MRIDRSLTLHFFRPLRSLGLRPRAFRLPILMYHSISETAEPGLPPYYRVCTSAQRFAQQMQFLSAAGWHGVTLQEGLDLLTGKKPIAARPVAITFDDGFHDFCTTAFPILQQYRFAATVYLSTAFIGNDQRSFKSRPCLNWSEIRELHRSGIEFGSHTVNHPVLYDLSWREIENELQESRSQIEDQLACPVCTFAYPYAFPQTDLRFVRRFCDLLRRSGYENSVTTIIGRVRREDDFFLLPRLPVNNGDDRSLFEAKVSGAYDWMALPQYLRKKAGRWA